MTRWREKPAKSQQDLSRFLASILALGLLAVGVGCRGEGSAASPVSSAAGGGWRCEGCNVVVVSIDTLRADRMSVYGYDRPTTPFLETLAQDGVVFENFVHNGGGTLPSHMTMLTSLYPRTHDVDIHSGTGLADKWTTLAEVLKNHGYATLAVTDGGWMSGKFGFARGFDIFDDEDVHGHLEVNQPKVHRWIEQHQDEPFLVFAHTYDVHSQTRQLPYECPNDEHHRYTGDYDGDFDGCIGQRCASKLLSWLNDGAQSGELDIGDYLSPDDIEYISSLYDGCINYVDGKLEELVVHLRKLGLYDRTLIVVTSDHGEEFLDHGLLTHRRGGFEEIVRVPLVMKLPYSAERGGRVEHLAAMVDLFPTVVDIVGLPAPGQVQGRSLMPAVLEDAPVRKATHMYGALRTDRWKFLASEGELYDLYEDPDETRNVAADRAKLAGRLHDHLRGLLKEDLRHKDRLPGDGADAEKVTMTEEEIEHLKSIGYLQ